MKNPLVYNLLILMTFLVKKKLAFSGPTSISFIIE